MARHNKKRGLSGKEAAAVFNVSPQTFCEWEKKGWVVRFPDKSVDESATRIRIDTYRDPFVGGKSDRGVEPKPLLARAGAGGQAGAGEITASLRGGLRGVEKAAGKSRARIGKRQRGDEFLPSQLESPCVAAVNNPLRTLQASTVEGAGCLFTGLSSDGSVAAVNKGQFSAWEVLAAALELTGPADVVVCTYTTAGEAIMALRRMLDDGRITSLRMILDSSFASREPEYCQHLLAQIGNDHVRTTRNHAKWCVLTNARWNLVIRGSANFGTAPRLEFFEASDDARLARFLNAIADELWERAPVWNFDSDGEGVQFTLAPEQVEEAKKASEQSGRLTVDQLAAALHITRNRVTRLRTAGVLTFDDDGCTTVERARKEIRSNGSQNRSESIDSDETAPGGPYVDIVEARRLKEVAEAGIAQMKEAQMRGDLIKREDAERVYCDSIAKARANLEAIPNRCAELLVGQTDAAVVRSMLTREIEAALSVVCGEVPSVS